MMGPMTAGDGGRDPEQEALAASIAYVLPLEDGDAVENAALWAAVAVLREDHHDVTVTEHGRPVAVLVDPEELASLRETVDIIRTPGTPEAIDEGLADLDAGREVDGSSFLGTLRERLNDRA